MCFKKQFTHVILCAQEKCLINYDTFFRDLWWTKKFKQQLFELHVHLNKLECCGKVYVIQLKLWNS